MRKEGEGLMEVGGGGGGFKADGSFEVAAEMSGQEMWAESVLLSELFWFLWVSWLLWPDLGR